MAPPPTYPTTEQADQLVTKASQMAGRIIRFLAETGMRQEEVCGLEWSRVSIQRREVRLTKTKTSSPRVGRATERRRHRHTDRHTSAYHLGIRVLAR
jgi:integrase